jgi:hypothetical protein
VLLAEPFDPVALDPQALQPDPRIVDLLERAGNVLRQGIPDVRPASGEGNDHPWAVPASIVGLSEVQLSGSRQLY